MKYHHRQFNFITVSSLIGGLFFSLFLALNPDSLIEKYLHLKKLYLFTTGYWEMYAIVISVVIYVVVVISSTMVVQINNKTLRWYFGLGFPFKSVPLREIIKITIVRNKWWNGWGIRKISSGWLYNVSGLDAIEVELTCGKVIRIGSNEVGILERQLSKAVSVSASRRAH